MSIKHHREGWWPSYSEQDLVLMQLGSGAIQSHEIVAPAGWMDRSLPGPQWTLSPDGSFLVVRVSVAEDALTMVMKQVGLVKTRTAESGMHQEFWQVPLEAGTPRRLRSLPSDTGDFSLAPDSRTLVYWVGTRAYLTTID